MYLSEFNCIKPIQMVHDLTTLTTNALHYTVVNESFLHEG